MESEKKIRFFCVVWFEEKQKRKYKKKEIY